VASRASGMTSDMQDPIKTIKDILHDQWSIDDKGLTKDDITWRFGSPEDLTTRFNERIITAEFSALTTPKEKRSLIRAIARKIVTADFWMLVDPVGDIEAMSGDKQKIIDEVEELIKLNERTAAGLDLIYVSLHRNLDRMSERTMREQFEIVCQYQT